MSDAITLDINGIMRTLPHRYPFLLVDRVLECVRGQSIRALKNVTFNEPFFTGHFPSRDMTYPKAVEKPAFQSWA